MAWTKAAAKKGAAAMHAKGLSSAQVAADRANLAKGRAKALSSRKRSVGVKKAPKPYTLGNRAAKRVNSASRFSAQKGMRAPLGTRRIAFHQTVKLAERAPTGRHKKFRKRISPGGFDRRTAWGKSSKHHMVKRLHTRKRKTVRVSHFSGRRRRITPR